MLAQQTISIQVSSAAAQAYQNASATERKKIELLLSLRLLEIVQAQPSLVDVMRDISQTAQTRGLTPAMLDELCKD